ncbi:MAG: preprotein translocase subunit SecE [Desulfovibrionaceae bacterium]
MKKVVWPSRKETISTSVAVLIFTVVASVFLGLVDFGLTKLLSVIL